MSSTETPRYEHGDPIVAQLHDTRHESTQFEDKQIDLQHDGRVDRSKEGVA